MSVSGAGPTSSPVGSSAVVGTAVVSVIVVTWNTRDRTLATLAAVASACAPYALDLIVVDNGSDDDSADAARAAFPSATVVALPSNVGFARGANAARAHLRGDVVVFLNSDAVPRPGSLAALADHLHLHPDVGIVVPPLVDPAGVPQKSGWRLPTIGAIVRTFTPLGWFARARRGGGDPGLTTRGPAPFVEVETVSGACLAVRRELLDALGGFDEGFPFYVEDVDLCWRASRRGARLHALLVGPAVVHEGGASSASVRGRLRLPLLQGTLRHLRRRLPRRRFALVSTTLKVGYLVRTSVACAVAAIRAGVAMALGRRAAAMRAVAAAREHLTFLDRDVLPLLRASGGPATLRRASRTATVT